MMYWHTSLRITKTLLTKQSWQFKFSSGLQFCPACAVRYYFQTPRMPSKQPPVATDYHHMTFSRIYRFPHIVLLRGVSRLKLYQTGLTLFSLHPMSYCYAVGQVSQELMQAYVGVASLAFVMLYIMSGYFRRLIGMMHLSDSGDILRVSRLTFWGNRRDIYMPVSDVVPLSEVPDRPMDVYLKFRRYSTPDFLYWTAKYGSIEDPEKFSLVFGSLGLSTKLK